jgi:hypothetical protein
MEVCGKMGFVTSYLTQWVSDNPGWVLYFFAGLGIFIAGMILSREPKEGQK